MCQINTFFWKPTLESIILNKTKIRSEMIKTVMLNCLCLCSLSTCYIIPREIRAETIYIQEQSGYLPFTATVGVELEQVQDFICPENHDVILYLVPELSKSSLVTCNIRQLQIIHHCEPYQFSKFTLYYSPMTPSGGLEFTRGNKYWIVSSDCSIQIKIYIM